MASPPWSSADRALVLAPGPTGTSEDAPTAPASKNAERGDTSATRRDTAALAYRAVARAAARAAASSTPGSALLAVGRERR